MNAISDSDEIFFHGVNLDDMFVLPLLNNILKFGRAYSPDYISRIEPGMRKAHHSMRDIDIQELRDNPLRYQGLCTPGAGSAIVLSSMLRAGMSLSMGAINPRPFPEDRVEYVLMKSDIELKFEEARRRFSPKAVSRLNCLYVTGNIEVIKGILGPYVPILKVRIPIKRGSWISRVDIRWFDAYCDAYKHDDLPRCIESIENYWKSRPYEIGVNTWEYLVDGMIEVVDGLDDLRAALDKSES